MTYSLCPTLKEINDAFAIEPLEPSPKRLRIDATTANQRHSIYESLTTEDLLTPPHSIGTPLTPQGLLESFLTPPTTPTARHVTSYSNNDQYRLELNTDELLTPPTSHKRPRTDVWPTNANLGFSDTQHLDIDLINEERNGGENEQGSINNSQPTHANPPLNKHPTRNEPSNLLPPDSIDQLTVWSQTNFEKNRSI